MLGAEPFAALDLRLLGLQLMTAPNVRPVFLTDILPVSRCAKAHCPYGRKRRFIPVVP